MKNKLIEASLVLLLVLFSFYYTDKVINFIRQNDPIMKSIIKESNNYEINPINAKIYNNTIVPGINGSQVDYNESFKKMKKYGTYNESLTVFKNVEPTISIDDYYDKYISQGNGMKNDISLIFIVDKNDNIDNILKILNDNKVPVTFFIDGLWIENNIQMTGSISSNNHELEILSYDNRYNELYFNSSINLLKNITKKNPKYCLAKYDNKKVIELCEKLKMHTIIPTIITGNYPYRDIKRRMVKGSIISFDITPSLEIELQTIINYIKQKGYTIKKIDDLLSESKEEK